MSSKRPISPERIAQTKLLTVAHTQGKLTPDDVQGGTFTITNPGGFGTFHGTPIISQPQAGILGTYAVVTRDVAPFMIVAGVPAQPLRSRFAPRICDRLLDLAWWDWDHARLRSALDDFRRLPAEDFLERYEVTA